MIEEDIDGMDDDAGEVQAQNPPFTGRWTATVSVKTGGSRVGGPELCA